MFQRLIRNIQVSLTNNTKKITDKEINVKNLNYNNKNTQEKIEIEFFKMTNLK